MEKYFFYKMSADNGGAPCVFNRLLSLAICKPAIRASADAGDWIFGFASNSHDQFNRLIYIAEITEKLRTGKYYQQRDYARRSDCIYEYKGVLLERKQTAKYHEDRNNMDRDLGEAPDYSKAHVLLSKNFRYFGKTQAPDWKGLCPQLSKVVSQLKQGHRVNHPANLRCELGKLKQMIWNEYPRQMKLGEPTTRPDNQSTCGLSGACIKIKEHSVR